MSWAGLAAIALAMLLAVAGVWLHYEFGQSWDSTSGHAVGSDDAFISYRYSWNLFNGEGLVFNLGERVEGYSNFLFTVLLTPAFWVSKDFVYPFAVACNTVFLLATVAAFAVHMLRSVGPKAALVGTFILCSNPWIWANAATGLETPLIMLLVSLGWIGAERHAASGDSKSVLLLAAVSCLSILSRIDGFILPVAVAVFLALRGRRSAAAIVLSAVGATIAAYTAARFAYYGDVMGNTFYAKVSGPLDERILSGLGFLAENGMTTGMWLPFGVAVAGFAAEAIKAGAANGVGRGFKTIVEAVGFPMFFCGLWLSYLVAIGGDIYYERFLVPLLPLVIFDAMRALAGLGHGRLVTGAALILFAQTVLAPANGRFDYAADKYDCWRNLGVFLGANHPNATLAVDAAGKIPFYSELPTIDMLGLNDRHIGKGKPVEGKAFFPGHNKFDADYVLGRKPDLIAAWFSPPSDFSWGLSRAKISKEYQIKYLVNTERIDRKPDNIIDATGLSADQIRFLHRHGYRYGVLIRKDYGRK